MRVLVVDDSRSSLAFLTQTISQLEGCEAESFLKPSAALARCGEVQFDLVLVDNIMPEIDGLEQGRGHGQAFRLVRLRFATDAFAPCGPQAERCLASA